MPFLPTPRSKRDEALWLFVEADSEESAVIKCLAHEVRRLAVIRKKRLGALEHLADAQVMEDEALEQAA